VIEINRVVPRTLPGFMELLPDEQILFNKMQETIKNSYERFGFLPLDTPIIESAGVLLAKTGGETDKQIYSFSKGNTDLAMRFDLTVPLAKYVSINSNSLTFPFRRYQIGKVYRGERAQAGRFREFYQADIDIIGNGELELINDAEIPSVIYTTFKELGFDNFTIKINNRKILNGLFLSIGESKRGTDIMRIIDKVDKIGIENVRNELNELNVRRDAIEKIMSFLAIQGSSDVKIETLKELSKELSIDNELFKRGIYELESVVDWVRLFGVPEDNFVVDLIIARGLDYYTGTVYETFLDQYREIGSICSGGRYDNLAEFYTEKKLPGVGISIGLTRLFYQLNKMNLINISRRSISEVLIIPMDENLNFALLTATNLRSNGINTEIYLNSNRKLKDKFSYANKLKIPFTIIIGNDERNSGMLTLKNMDTGKQSLLSIETIIAQIRQK